LPTFIVCHTAPGASAGFTQSINRVARRVNVVASNVHAPAVARAPTSPVQNR
jgi:hypothetical protein